MNVIPIPQVLKSAFMPEKDPTVSKRSTAETKGKGRELRTEAMDDDVGPSNRVWLGSDTPYKGPNKWFGGTRLPNRESLASQTVLGMRKTDQNILFGIATPQLPTWATDSPSNSKHPKPPQRQQLKQWPDREAPPHIPRASEGRRASRYQPDDNPPDDEGDDDGDNEGDQFLRSNRHQRSCRPSCRGTSSKASSSRGHGGGGGGCEAFTLNFSHS